MPEPLTRIETQILDYLIEYLRRNTYQPSIREIGRQFDIKSTKTVSEHLQSLADKGWIELSVEHDPERVIFYVKDSGPGIAPQHRERVFEPFRQVEQSTRRTKGGTGLGLSVSRKLARLMGGDLEIGDSSTQGSTFVFWLSTDGLE